MYNWALDLRSRSYREGVKINYTDTSKLLTELKKNPEYKWLNDVASVPLQQSIRNLQVAFNNFFNKSLPNAKYPSFKSKSSRQSANYVNTAFRFKENGLYITGLGVLNINFHRDLPSEPKSLSIIKDCDNRYYVSFVVEVKNQELEKTNNEIGIDLGVKTFAVTSNEEEYKGINDLLKPMYSDLKGLQKKLSRKKNSSNNRKKVKVKIAKKHSKISRIRKDYLDKLSKKIVEENDLIIIEDLAVKEMTKNQGQSKKNINQAMISQGWNMFSNMLSYKAELYGRELKKIDRYFPSSKMCSNCGKINKDLKIKQRNWDCSECKSSHNRDINAAKNILTAGTVVYTRLEDRVIFNSEFA